MPSFSHSSGPQQLAALTTLSAASLFAGLEPDGRNPLAGHLEINHPVLQVGNAEAHRLAAEPHQHAVGVHVPVIRRIGGDIDVLDPHRREALLDALAVEQLDPCIMRGLHPPIGDQRVDIGLAGAEPEIAHPVEVDRRGVATHRHQRLELAVDLVPVLRHADVLGHGEQLPDAAGGARGGGEFISRIGFDDDDIGGVPRQCQVIGNRGADNAAADDRDLCHVRPSAADHDARCARRRHI
jgi:hypothetical protein